MLVVHYFRMVLRIFGARNQRRSPGPADKDPARSKVAGLASGPGDDASFISLYSSMIALVSPATTLPLR